MKEVILHLRRWQILAAFVVLTASYVVGIIVITQNYSTTHKLSHKAAALSISNSLAIAELNHQKKQIEEARVHSCKETYGAFTEVLSPFFPPSSRQTSQEKAQLDKLNNIIHRLQAKCSEQTRVKKGSVK